MAFGLLSTGFVRKHLADIVDDLEAALQAAFGINIRLDSKSVFGKLVGAFAQPAADVWELAEAVFNSFYPSTAEGTALDNCCELVGVTRIPATQSTVTEVLEGTVGTTIGINSKVATVTVGDQFQTTAAITLAASVAVRSTTSLVGAVVHGKVYTITINGTPFTYTATVPPDDADAVSLALKNLINAGAEPVTATDLTGGELQVDGDAGADGLPTPFALVINANLSIDKVGNLQAMESVEYGAVIGYASTLTDIVTQVSGWTAAWNPLAATLGNEEETDSALRLRRALSLATPGSGTVDAIRAAVLSVSAVTAAFVLENTGDAVDGNGLPGHSFEVVVLGGDGDDIAEEIWDHKGAGIYSHGVTPVVVSDSQGFSQTVRYTRPSEIDIWVRGTYTEDPEADPGFPTNGEDLMETAMLATGQALTIGEDALPAHFYGPVLAACTGIRTLLIEISLDGIAWVNTPLAIAALEISAFEIAHCEATL